MRKRVQQGPFLGRDLHRPHGELHLAEDVIVIGAFFASG
jgi:hypothetical protein